MKDLVEKKRELEKDCLFCQMALGHLPVSKIYDDQDFFCIQDIQPQAKIHLLMIPKQHYQNIVDFALNHSEGSLKQVASFFKVATQIAQDQGLWPGGFRFVMNSGSQACQSVLHLHLHILGGETLQGKFGS